MQNFDPNENPFKHDSSLKTLLTYKEQENNNKTRDEYHENIYDRLYFTNKGSTNYGMIKKLEEQALGLSDMRHQILTNDKSKVHSSAANSYVGSVGEPASSRRTELPSLHQSQKHNIKQYIKEKKETLGDFLNKGKEIFLGKMMMDMKREETLRLTEFIINEEETLNEHEADFREHVKFSNTFIQDLNKDAEKTINESKDKTKEINKEHNKIAQLEQQIRTLESQIKKKEEDKETYEDYKKFFKEIYEPAFKNLVLNKAAQKQDPSKFFLTQKAQVEEGGSQKVPQSKKSLDQEVFDELEASDPQQMVEILKKIHDDTIFLIHNTQEKEEDLEKTRKALEVQKEQVDEKYKKVRESLAQVQKLHEKLERENNQAHEKLCRLKLVDEAPQDDLDGGLGFNKDKIKQTIHSMCVNLKEENDKEVVQPVTNSTDVLKAMKALEDKLEKLIKWYNDTTKHSSQDVKLLSDIQNKLKKEIWQEKAQLKQAQDRQKNQEALEKQKHKRVVLRKGRRPMNKIFKETKKEVEEVIDDDAGRNDDERYFKDSFAFMDASKGKAPIQEDN